MADDPLAAELKKIRDRDGIAYASPRTMAESGADVSRLLAAVEAALSAADGWKLFAAEGDAQDECADELRKVIAAALTGKGNDGAVPS